MEGAEKTLDERKAELLRILQMTQIKLIQLNQRQAVLEKQEKLLKEQAHILNDRVIAGKVKLEDARRQSEEHVEEFIERINRSLDENKKCLTAVKGKKKEDIMEYEKRRKRYYELQGEREALLLYKEYQECIIDELKKLETPGM